MSEEPFGLPLEIVPDIGVTMTMGDPKDLKEGDSVVLFLIKGGKFTVIKGKYKIEGLAHKKFHLVLMEEHMEDEAERKELAKLIVKMHSKVLVTEALKSVEIALSRKPKEKLEALMIQTKKGKKAEMHSRKGCMFLQIGKEATVL